MGGASLRKGRCVVRPKLLLTIRTANRAPKRNYLARTVQNLIAHGVEPDQIHVFATHPDVSWLPEMPDIGLHVPAYRLTPNENGVAPIRLLHDITADWIILSEDDLEWCDDPLDTMARWLATYAQPDVLVYRFFAFDRLTPRGKHVASAPLKEQKGSQVIALRAADALRFAAWATVHRTDWRPKWAPFQDRPHDGFDKLVGYWALQDRPLVPFGFVSQPFFVKHVGLESSLHSHGRQMDAAFRAKPYAGQEAAWP